MTISVNRQYFAFEFFTLCFPDIIHFPVEITLIKIKSMISASIVGEHCSVVEGTWGWEGRAWQSGSANTLVAKPSHLNCLVFSLFNF